MGRGKPDIAPASRPSLLTVDRKPKSVNRPRRACSDSLISAKIRDHSFQWRWNFFFVKKAKRRKWKKSRLIRNDGLGFYGVRLENLVNQKQVRQQRAEMNGSVQIVN